MMKYLGGTTAMATLVAASTALAGGIERSVLNLGPLYEDGRYLEFSSAVVLPDLEGTGGFVPPLFGGPLSLTGSTGNILDNYTQFGLSYKADLKNGLSYALILNQPYGADTNYPGPFAAPPDATGVYGGSFADLESWALTALLAYDVSDRVKVYGGPVVQALEAGAALPFIPVGGYSVDADRDYGIGAVVGASYSIPDIALRVALTYRSAIDHDLDTTETVGRTVFTSQTDVETPQSLTLDFQTGIMADTLLFGQVHWVDWSEFRIAPPNYPPLALGRALVDYADDWTTYTLGVGRRIDENLSAAVSVTYEPQTDTEMTSLGPVDGRLGLNLGATYESETMKISGGISFTQLGSALNVLNTDYDDGNAIGVGFRIGWKL